MIMNYILLECSGAGLGPFIAFAFCLLLLMAFVAVGIVLSLVKLYKDSKIEKMGKDPAQENRTLHKSVSVVWALSLTLLVITLLMFARMK